MALANKDRIKRMLVIPAGITYLDTAIDDILTVADQMVLDELGLTDTGVTAYTESIDITASGLNECALTYRPVVTMTALTVNGSALTEDTDYTLDYNLGIIKLKPINAGFDVGREAVQASYTAGFSSVPPDVTYAANLIAVMLMNQQSHVGYKQEKTSSYSYNMGSAAGERIPAVAQRILSKHKRLFARGTNQ